VVNVGLRRYASNIGGGQHCTLDWTVDACRWTDPVNIVRYRDMKRHDISISSLAYDMNPNKELLTVTARSISAFAFQTTVD